VTLKFRVKNRKEDAHAAEFHLWHPAEFTYRLSSVSAHLGGVIHLVA
jgi:hypothetical protein